MHLAAALKVPTLTLFFGTDPEIWHPPVSSSHYLKGNGLDPKTLEPAQVSKLAEQILQSRRPVSGQQG